MHTFDFVVVGGGNAGAVVASRLAHSNLRPSILLIEAGTRNDDRSLRISGEKFKLVAEHPELNWGYVSTPQANLLGRRLPLFRGKGLGGSTVLNFTIYTEGSAEDYNLWAELVGDQEWSWPTVKQRFHRIESFHPAVPDGFNKYAEPIETDHGINGPVDVSWGPVWESGRDQLLDASSECGFEMNIDLNSGNPIGFGMSPSTVYNGMRITSSSAYLRDVPPNLTIMTSLEAVKILFEGKRAIGVMCSDGNSIFASKELILAGGAVNTPKLLLLSGVGPSENLSKHGIPTVQDIPGIGQNLQDHCQAVLPTILKPGLSDRHSKMEINPEALAKEREQWMKDQTGLLTIYTSSLVTAFLKFPALKNSNEIGFLDQRTKDYVLSKGVPHFEILSGGGFCPPGVADTEEYLNFTIGIMVPQSRGQVTLQSTDPADPPLIDPNYLDHPLDRRHMVEGIRTALRYIKSPKIAKYLKSFVRMPEDEDDESILEYARKVTNPFFHLNGTVKMGNADDPMACVDSHFRVRGLQSLRVVDLSVCPITPNCHTQSVAYLIGETASDFLIDEYNL